MANITAYDLIRLSSGVLPADGTLSIYDGDLLGLAEPIVFTTVGADTNISLTTTVTISGRVFDVTALSTFTGEYTSSNGVVSAPGTFVTIVQQGNPLNVITFMIPPDTTDSGQAINLPDLSVISVDNLTTVTSVATAPIDTNQTVTLGTFDPAFVIDGTAGNDLINLSYVDADGDRVDAFDNALGNNDDIIMAGAGDDTVIARFGDDTIFGGDGNDVVSGVEGNDYVDGGAGDDTVIGDSGNDTLFGGTGHDTVSGGTGDDTLFGGAGDDSVLGREGRDTLDGGTGTDTLDGGDGDDLFILSDNWGLDTIIGGEAAETSGDVLDASGLSDDLTLNLSANGAANAESGILTPTVGFGTDQASFIEIESVILGSGDDSIIGSSGADSVDAGAGADIIDGGAGNDHFDLGAATSGGSDGDADLFVFSDGDGDDALVNFDVPIDNGDGTFTGVDTLDVSALTNLDGDPVDTNDVTVTTDVNGDAVLTFPNGESLTFAGVPASSLDHPLELEAIGIPLAPASNTTVYDMIQLSGGVPGLGDVLTAGMNADLIEIDEPIDFTTILNGQILVGDTAIIDGTSYTVTFLGSGTGDFTHLNASGVSEVVTATFGTITLDDGSGGVINYIVPNANAGDIPDISQIEVTGAIGPIGFFSDPNAFGADDIVTLLCFAGGTKIETVEGHTLVEDLTVGQLVQTMDHGPQPIRWIGRRTVAAIGKHAPIVIKKGTMGNARDLRVSPQHRMLVQGWQTELLFGQTKVLAAAKHLENGDTIYVEEGGTVEYFHILFDQHEVIYAEGALSESFHPGEMTANSISKESADKLLAVFPELINDPDSYGAAAYTSLRSYEARLLAHNIYSQNSMAKLSSKKYTFTACTVM